MQQWLNKIPSWLKNKYVLAVLFFAVWSLFLADTSAIELFELNGKLNKLKVSQANLTAEIKTTDKQLKQLKTNTQTIEKFAREQYYMKKDNEDLFIVKPAETPASQKK
jgi:cell division protein DivIC